MDATHTLPARRPVAWPLHLFRRRTWAGALYAVLALPLGIAGFVVALVTLTVGLGISITLAGLPVLAASAVVCRALGDSRRRLANTLLGSGIAAPPPLRRDGGRKSWVVASIKDPTAWRARLYLLLSLPVGIAGFVATVTFLVTGLGGVTYWIWRPFLPCQSDGNGVCHHATSFGPHYYVDTPGRIALLAVASAVVLVVAPLVIRAIIAVDEALMRRLLGPAQSPVRGGQA